MPVRSRFPGKEPNGLRYNSVARFYIGRFVVRGLGQLVTTEGKQVQLSISFDEQKAQFDEHPCGRTHLVKRKIKYGIVAH